MNRKRDFKIFIVLKTFKLQLALEIFITTQPDYLYLEKS